MTEANKDFIQLYSGIDFYFLEPDPDKILLEDIAHTLSLLCRFGGHCREFYSVAEHSVRCSNIVAPEYAFEALMHDASEAYLVDMPRPIKNVLKEYKKIEINLDKVIRLKYGLPEEMSEQVHWADNVMLATERRDLMPEAATPWVWLPEPYGPTIKPLSPQQAQEAFLYRYYELNSKGLKYA